MNGTLPGQLQPLCAQYLQYMDKELPGLLSALYVYGSVTLQDYQAGYSDLDMIAILARPLQISEQYALRKLHRSFSKAWPRPALDVVYLNQAQLNVKQRALYQYVNGRLKPADVYEPNPVSQIQLQNNAVVLRGQVPASAPSSEELKTWILQNQEAYWKPWLKKIQNPFSPWYYAAYMDFAIAWAVLGLGRQYFSIKESGICSKTQAGNYLLPISPPEFQALVQEALRIRRQERQSIYLSCRKRKKDLICWMNSMLKLCST